ncbi:MAG: glycosyltransferase family 2 protein [Acidobacteriota bacterium]
MSTPRATILLRCKNSDTMIGPVLKSLASQEYQDFVLEVIDSGSTDRTLEYIEHFEHRLHEIRPEQYVPGRVLNGGAERADTELLVCLNSDCYMLHPQALGNLIAVFDDPEVQAAYARQVARPEHPTWVQRDYEESFPPEHPAPPWITLSMPLAAMRRSVWEERQFYDEAWGSEDTEWGHWAKENGKKIVYVPDSLVMHSHDYTFRQLYGRRFIEGEADAFIYGEDASLIDVAKRTLSSAARDAVACAKARDVKDMVSALPRRFVFHWAWYQGHQHGTKRRETGDKDIRTGQKIVLDRHESHRE